MYTWNYVNKSDKYIRCLKKYYSKIPKTLLMVSEVHNNNNYRLLQAMSSRQTKPNVNNLVSDFTLCTKQHQRKFQWNHLVSVRDIALSTFKSIKVLARSWNRRDLTK